MDRARSADCCPAGMASQGPMEMDTFNEVVESLRLDPTDDNIDMAMSVLGIHQGPTSPCRYCHPTVKITMRMTMMMTTTLMMIMTVASVMYDNDDDDDGDDDGDEDGGGGGDDDDNHI